MASRLVHLPNAITGVRMLLAAPLAWFVLERRFDEALVVALAAGLSDALDGFLAKRYRWQTWLGGVLDPIADKLMLVAAFGALAIEGAVPAWAFALVLGRDCLIVAGALAYHWLIGRVTAAPTRLSKLTTLVQIVYVLAVLVDLLDAVALPRAIVTGLLIAVAVSTVASGLHYVLSWSLRARAHGQRRRVANGP